jgi:hypothetical protein
MYVTGLGFVDIQRISRYDAKLNPQGCSRTATELEKKDETRVRDWAQFVPICVTMRWKYLNPVAFLILSDIFIFEVDM